MKKWKNEKNEKKVSRWNKCCSLRSQIWDFMDDFYTVWTCSETCQDMSFNSSKTVLRNKVCENNKFSRMCNLFGRLEFLHFDTFLFKEALNQNWNLSITFMTSLGSDFQTLFAAQVANFTRVDVLKAETWNLSGRLEGQTTQIWTFAKLGYFLLTTISFTSMTSKKFYGQKNALTSHSILGNCIKKA